MSIQPSLEVTIRVKTKQSIVHNSIVEGNPLHTWEIELCMLDQHGEEAEVNILKSCTFHLHPTYTDPVRTVAIPPYKIQDTAWGEFGMKIKCIFIDGISKFQIDHDLLFIYRKYSVDFTVKVPYHRPGLRGALVQHFDILSKDSFELDTTKTAPDFTKMIHEIPTYDEDTVTDIVQLILSHPAVQNVANMHPRGEEFKIDIGNLPDDLLLAIEKYIKDH